MVKPNISKETIKNIWEQNKTTAIIILAALFMLVALVVVRAGGPFAGFEAEGAIGDNVIVRDDANASGGQYVEFSAGTEPSDPSSFDRVLKNGEDFPDGFTVPAGQEWGFDPGVTTTVTSAGNIVVEGKLTMTPTSADVIHTLKFRNVDETKFVGGHTEAPQATDVGLWVIKNGILNAVGTPRAGWNRTGMDGSWRSGDDIYVAPQTSSGYSDDFARYTGGTLPSVTGPDGKKYTTEVFNVTRNVRIVGGGNNSSDILSDNGRAHVIFLLCNQPQTIKYVEFSHLGPRGPHSRDGTDGVLGRYALHFHQCGEGTRGSLIEGVVARNNGNHSFVPHSSHGMTFRDTISFDNWENGYWWDDGHETNDTLYDHTAAFLLRDHPSFRGYSLNGYTLGSGTGNVVRDSVAAGVQANSVNAGGFHWPASSNGDFNIWDFSDSNVAHNNRGPGVSAWQNDSEEHVLENFVSYFNGEGINHGAYLNTYAYRNVVLFGNSNDIELHALSNGSGQLWENIIVGNNIEITKHQLNSNVPIVFRNLDLRGKIIVDENSIVGNIRFVSTDAKYDLSLSDFVVRNLSSSITVQNSNGSTFTVE